MTQLSFIFAVLALASIVAGWIWKRRHQMQEELLAKQRTGEESETPKRNLSDENGSAEAKARDVPRPHAKTEERIPTEAEAEEEAQPAKEQRLSVEKLKAKSEANRQYAREGARLQAESEAKQRARAEQRRSARIAEEQRLAEERRQAEERTKAEAEEHEGAQAVEEARLHADETEENGKVTKPVAKSPLQPKPPEEDGTPRPPVYRPPAPSPTTTASQPRVSSDSRTAKTSSSDLPQLAHFGNVVATKAA